MEANFQTSFIPKKPVVKERAVRAPSVSFATIIAFIIFFASVLLVGGTILYKGNLEQAITTKSNELDLARGRFEEEKLNQLQSLDRRLIASEEVLAGHIAISPIFQDLQKYTMKEVQFTSFTYDFVDAGFKSVLVRMRGKAIDYRTIAVQSDLFSANKNFINPVFSNLVLDSDGNVLFDLEFSVDANFVDYRQKLLTELEDEDYIINEPVEEEEEELSAFEALLNGITISGEEEETVGEVVEEDGEPSEDPTEELIEEEINNQ
jgi:hypothetical protein